MKLRILILTLIMGVSSMNAMVLSEGKWSQYLDEPLTDWSNNTSIYDNAYQGATYDYSVSSKEAFENTLKTLPQEEQWVIQDWIYAVKQVEKSLLKKPFETWTFDDISQLAAWLLRSSHKDPRTIRTEPVRWTFRKISKEETEKFDTLLFRKVVNTPSGSKYIGNPQERPNALLQPLTAQEEAYLHETVYVFPLGDDVKKELIEAFESLKQELAKARALPWEQRQQKAFSLGCQFHFDIIRVHPFKAAAKRLGRLGMFIIHSQNGIMPLCVINAEAYTQSLLASLKEGTHRPFEKFYKTHVDRYDNLLKSTAQAAGPQKRISAEEHLRLMLLNFAAHEQSTDQTSLASSSSCASCGKQDPKQRCSICKAVYYCGQECQTKDWKAGHKKQCAKIAEKQKV